MKYLFISFSLLLIAACSFGKDGEYPVGAISPKLFKNANAVLRLEEVTFEIISTNKTRTRNHIVITILNEKGDHWAEQSESYSSLSSIESFEGYLYDSRGNELKKIKKKDTEDLSYADGSSMISDQRIRRHNFYYKVYPYTIEYIIETTSQSTLFFPSWMPQNGEFLSVESSVFQVICPKDYELRYKAFNHFQAPVVTETKSSKLSTWKTEFLPAVRTERFSPQWHDIVPMVNIGPSAFQVGDYKGNMVSWQDFGKFIYALTEGRDMLPDQTKQTVHDLTDNLADPRAKIGKLYDFMQQNTRYIGIQLGIGGWQPFPAKEVATKGYGDCKALTNYMYSLLKEAGIKSYYTLVHAGKFREYITEDFPSQQFNHVILCVPIEKDTMWLECTSQTKAPGFLGNFTANRPVLLVDKDGGRIIRTPEYKLKENVQRRTIKAKVDDEGSVVLTAVTEYTGLQQDDLHDIINSLSKEKVKEYMNEELSFSTYDINSFQYKENKSYPPSITESLGIYVSNYASITGRRLFINPNLMNRTISKIQPDSTRKYDIRLLYAYHDIDSVEIDVPEGYEIESLPSPVNIKGSFGNYITRLEWKENKIIFHRSIEHFSGTFPKSKYPELVSFYESIHKADHSRVVLVKKAS